MNIELQQSRQMEGEKPPIWYISKCVQREYQHFWTHIEKKMHEKKSHYVLLFSRGEKNSQNKRNWFSVVGNESESEKKC